MRKRETEIKLKVGDMVAMRARLRELGMELREKRSLEDNFLFDTPDRALRKVRSILRLRRYAGKWIVTYKGTPVADKLYKSRLELESGIDNPEAIRLLFEALGFRPVFRYQKYRSHYVPRETSGRRKASLEVALDETPIGNFLEIEGSRRSIDRAARQLGYNRSDYSTASYGALYLEDCRNRNIKPGDMVFPSKARGKKRIAAPGSSVILTKLPPGLLRGLPREDQKAIRQIVGKPVLLERYDDDGRAELKFNDAYQAGYSHSIFVNPKFIKATTGR